MNENGIFLPQTYNLKNIAEIMKITLFLFLYASEDILYIAFIFLIPNVLHTYIILTLDKTIFI